MSTSKFELLRSASEAVENSEKVLAIAFQNRKKFLNKNDTAPVTNQGEDAADQEGEGQAEKVKVSDAIVS